MKKLLIAFIALTLISCTKEKGYIITGNLSNLNGKIYLTVYDGKQPVHVDSLDLTDGSFVFEGVASQVKLAAIESAEKGVVATFFLENSPISIDGDAADSKAVAIKGSASFDEYSTYIQKYRANIDSTLNYIKTSPSSPVAAYVLFREVSYQLPYQELESLIAGFTPEVQESVYLQTLGERVAAMKRSDVGQPYINISLPDTSGMIVSLSSLIDAGNYVLVDFWASWCPPCREENPHVVAAYNMFKDKGFTVYGVSLDREKGRDAWIKAINDDKLAWTNVSDLKFWDCMPAKEYGVSSIPSNFLISPEGVIVGCDLRGEELTAKLNELLNK